MATRLRKTSGTEQPTPEKATIVQKEPANQPAEGFINGTYTNGIYAFRSTALPSNPLPFLFAFADCIRQHGIDWIRNNQGKALLFPVLLMAYGTTFQLNSVTEFERLDQTIPRA